MALTLKDVLNKIISTTGGNIDILSKLSLDTEFNFEINFINERGNSEQIFLESETEYTGNDYFAPAQESQVEPETTVGPDTNVGTTTETPTEAPETTETDTESQNEIPSNSTELSTEANTDTVTDPIESITNA
jgi:hypothetical protein